MTQGDPGRASSGQATTLGSPRSPSHVRMEGVDVGGLARWAEAAAPRTRQRSWPLQDPAPEKDAGSWEVRPKARGRRHTPGCRDAQERGQGANTQTTSGRRGLCQDVSGGPGLPDGAHALQAPPEGTVPITLALGTQRRTSGSLEGTERGPGGRHEAPAAPRRPVHLSALSKEVTTQKYVHHFSERYSLESPSGHWCKSWEIEKKNTCVHGAGGALGPGPRDRWS